MCVDNSAGSNEKADVALFEWKVKIWTVSRGIGNIFLQDVLNNSLATLMHECLVKNQSSFLIFHIYNMRNDKANNIIEPPMNVHAEGNS